MKSNKEVEMKYPRPILDLKKTIDVLTNHIKSLLVLVIETYLQDQRIQQPLIIDPKRVKVLPEDSTEELNSLLRKLVDTTESPQLVLNALKSALSSYKIPYKVIENE